MSDPVANAALARIGNIAATVSRASRANRFEGYSLRRVIANLAEEQRRGYPEAEISQDLERTHPAQRGGIIVPWEVFATRADTVSNLTTGGYLVEALNLDAADALRPSMVTGGLGATIIPAPYGANVNLPKQSAVATATWLTTETTAVSETDQTFGQLAFTPHTVASYTELSRLLLLQSGPSPAETVVRRDLVSVVARALDLAALFGTGTAGQPKGLATTAGISTFSGTALSLTSIVNAAVALGDALDDSAGVAANRVTAGLLKTRQEAAGSTRLLWEGSLVAGTSVGFPARSSSALTAGSFFVGSWRYLNIVVWGDGIEVTVNPYGDQANSPYNFQRGIVGVRAFLTADAGATYPAAFAYASTVT